MRVLVVAVLAIAGFLGYLLCSVADTVAQTNKAGEVMVARAMR